MRQPRIGTRLTALEKDLYRRMEQMTDQELADLVGPGVLEVLDALSLDELGRVAQGNVSALHRFWDRLDQWQERHT